MKVMRYVRGCNKSDKIRNDTVRSDLTIFWINDYIEESLLVSEKCDPLETEFI